MPKTHNQQETSDGTVISGGNSVRTYSKRPLIYAVGGLIIVLLGLGWLILSGNSALNKPLAEVNGRKIYKQDVKSMTEAASNVSDKQAAVVLADKYLTEAMGKQANVSVSDQDLVAEFGDTAPQQKTENPFAYQNMRNQVYFTKLAAEYQGLYKGKLLVANFSRNVPYQSPSLAEKKVSNPKLGDPAAIAADKAYAQDFITGLYNQVKAGTMTFDQAIATERVNPVVGEEAYSTQSHSSAFNGPLSQISLLRTDSAQAQLKSIKPGELSKPFVVKVSSSLYDNSKSESYWLVVQLDKQSGGGNQGSFEQALAKAKKQLGYKIYV